MATIVFRTVGHFLAKAFQSLTSAGPAIEGVTQATQGSAQAVNIEKASFAVLGEISSILSKGGDAAKTKLADAGMDTAIITTIEELLTSVPELVALAKSL